MRSGWLRTTRGRRPAWLPTRVFDDGRRTWIEMPPQASATDLPPLFVVTGEGVELVNYRKDGSAFWNALSLPNSARNSSRLRVPSPLVAQP